MMLAVCSWLNRFLSVSWPWLRYIAVCMCQIEVRRRGEGCNRFGRWVHMPAPIIIWPPSSQHHGFNGNQTTMQAVQRNAYASHKFTQLADDRLSKQRLVQVASLCTQCLGHTNTCGHHGLQVMNAVSRKTRSSTHKRLNVV